VIFIIKAKAERKKNSVGGVGLKLKFERFKTFLKEEKKVFKMNPR
jgi:hypothetical protein